MGLLGACPGECQELARVLWGGHSPAPGGLAGHSGLGSWRVRERILTLEEITPPHSKAGAARSGQQILSRSLRPSSGGDAGLGSKLTLPSPHALSPRNSAGGSRTSHFQSEGTWDKSTPAQGSLPSQDGLQEGERQVARGPVRGPGSSLSPSAGRTQNYQGVPSHRSKHGPGSSVLSSTPAHALSHIRKGGE